MKIKNDYPVNLWGKDKRNNNAIEGDWRANNIYDDKNSIIAEIEKKIGQFHFMLNNEDLMAQANSKLDARYQTLGQADHYKEYINDKYLPEAKDALNIFQNYKIYDSVDMKV